MDHLQEKFQITVPPKAEASPDEDWVFPVRGTKNRVTQGAGFMHRMNASSASMEPMAPKFNQLPPGMEIDNQMRFTQDSMPLSLAGKTDVTDNVTPKTLIGGFTRLTMRATDDQYTGEHVDQFYGLAYGTDSEGDVVEGFAERNNYLDRE